MSQEEKPFFHKGRFHPLLPPQKKSTPLLFLGFKLQSENTAFSFWCKNWKNKIHKVDAIQYTFKEHAQLLRIGLLQFDSLWVTGIPDLWANRWFQRGTKKNSKLSPSSLSSLKQPKSAQGQLDLQTALNLLLSQGRFGRFGPSENQVQRILFKQVQCTKTQQEYLF